MGFAVCFLGFEVAAGINGSGFCDGDRRASAEAGIDEGKAVCWEETHNDILFEGAMEDIGSRLSGVGEGGGDVMGGALDKLAVWCGRTNKHVADEECAMWVVRVCAVVLHIEKDVQLFPVFSGEDYLTI